MKIPIYYIPKTRFKKFLFVEKKYNCRTEIVPVGCDCHPAYTLQKLNIRKKSLPFDWLNTESIKGLEFVSENLKNNFKYFLSNLYINKRGHIVSKKYPYSEFIHEKKLIEQKSNKEKFLRRIDRLKQLLNNEIYFLHNITSNSLQSEKNVDDFYQSVIEFKSQLKNNQILCIYIRYDESLNENENYCKKLITLLSNFRNIKISNYVREKKKEGIWGNEKYYPALYKSLGIKINLTFPKIYIK